MRVAVIFCIGLSMFALPAAAQSSADPALRASAQCYGWTFDLDTAQRTAFCAALAEGEVDDKVRLGRIDAALAIISERSQSNAMLMSAKAALLAHIGDAAGAEGVLVAALARYPDAPPLLALGVQSLTYSDRFALAAQWWLKLAKEAPALAKMFDNYYFRDILVRLRRAGDFQAARNLVTTLESIGYDPGPGGRAQVAEVLLRDAARTRDSAAARSALARLNRPEQMINVLADKAYEFAWPEVPWADEDRRADLVQQSVLSAMEAFDASPADAPEAIRAVASNVSPQLAVAYFAPLLDRALTTDLPQSDLFDYAFWLAPLARAHVLAGDEQSAVNVFRDAMIPLSRLESAARLNLDANLANLLLDLGKPAEALTVIDPAIDELSAMDAANSALVPMHAVRARALHELGRTAESWVSLEAMQSAGDAKVSYITTLLLTGRDDEAREAALVALRYDDLYGSVLGLFQPSSSPYRTAADRSLQQALSNLAIHPDVAEALAARGRILPDEPVLLPEFDIEQRRFAEANVE